MIAISQPSTSAFSDSIHLLLRLHSVMQDGSDGGKVGDEIRDQMETPWYEMNEVHQELVNGLAADLYSIGVDRPHPTGRPAPEAFRRFQIAVERNDWFRALESARSCQSELPADELAVIRGIAWMWLGYPEVAILFFDELVRLRQPSPNELLWQLLAAAQIERRGEYVSRAMSEAQLATNPLLLLAVSMLLSAEAGTQSTAQPPSLLLQSAIDAGERCLQAIAVSGNGAEFASAKLGAHLHLALDYDQIGLPDKALEHCQAALQLNPVDLKAMAIFGWLLNPDKSSHVTFRESLRSYLGSQIDLSAVPNCSLVSAA